MRRRSAARNGSLRRARGHGQGARPRCRGRAAAPCAAPRPASPSRRRRRHGRRRPRRGRRAAATRRRRVFAASASVSCPDTWASPSRRPTPVSTAYGSPRSPYSSRSAARCSRSRSGANATATSAVATSATAASAWSPSSGTQGRDRGGVADQQDGGERGVHEGAPHHDVDAEQVVAQDRHGDRDRQQRDRDERHHVADGRDRQQDADHEQARRRARTRLSCARSTSLERRQRTTLAAQAPSRPTRKSPKRDPAHQASKTRCGSGRPSGLSAAWWFSSGPGANAARRRPRARSRPGPPRAGPRQRGDGSRPSGNSSTPIVTSGMNPSTHSHADNQAAATPSGSSPG